MKFFNSLSYSHTTELTTLAQAAERGGLDGVSLAEHLFYPVHLRSEHPYSDPNAPAFERDELWPEPWTSIAAMAAVTKRLAFSTSVAIVALHHPVELARQLGNLALLSGNRVAIGAGVGWMREEFAALGVDFASRGRRADEMIALMRKLFSGAPVSHDGEFFSLDEVMMLPAPTRPVPVWIGGRSDRALRRAAELGDGWMATGGETVDQTVQLIDRLKRFRDGAGTTGRPFEIIAIQPFAAVGDTDLRRLRDAGVTQMMNYTLKLVLGEPKPSLAARVDYLESLGDTDIARFNNVLAGD